MVKTSHYDQDIANRNQTKIVFDVVMDMVQLCPALFKRVKILETQK